MKLLTIALMLVVAACAQVSVQTTTLSSGSLPESPQTSKVDGSAAEICSEHAWVGIAEPAEFTAEAGRLSVEPDVLIRAVRAACPETFYQPLSRAEVDWCGDGKGFGQNFFRVVQAGVGLGIESFSIIESGLVAKATNRNYDLSDYEVELLTAELQTMSESTRFERDWATACRDTF